MSEHDQNVVLSHEAVWELLPWYINDTLGTSERARVDAHLSSCLVCHRELDEQRQLQELVRQSDTLRISPRSSFDRLMRRIDSGSTADTRFSLGDRTPIFSWLPIAAALLVAGVVLVVLFSSAPERSGEFRTLSSETPSLQSDMAAVQMVFVEDATEEEIQGLVAGMGGRIVGGPSAGGVYTIELPDGAAQPGVLEQLRSDVRVRFVGQAPAGPSP